LSGFRSIRPLDLEAVRRTNRGSGFSSHSFFFLAKERMGEERKTLSKDASLCFPAPPSGRKVRGQARCRVARFPRVALAYFVTLPARRRMQRRAVRSNGPYEHDPGLEKECRGGALVPQRVCPSQWECAMRREKRLASPGVPDNRPRSAKANGCERLSEETGSSTLQIWKSGSFSPIFLARHKKDREKRIGRMISHKGKRQNTRQRGTIFLPGPVPPQRPPIKDPPAVYSRGIFIGFGHRAKTTRRKL